MINFALVNKKEQIPAVCGYFSSQTHIGADIETNNHLDPYLGMIRMIQLSDGNKSILIDVKECFPEYWVYGKDIKNEPEILRLKDLLETKGIIKVFHNGIFDAKWLKLHLNIEVNSVFDTMLASQLLDYDERHNLRAVAERELEGVEIDKAEQNTDWTGHLSKQKLEYAATDVHYLLQIYKSQRQKLIDLSIVKAAKIDFDCVFPYAQIELNGVHLNQKIYREKLVKVAELRKKAYDILMDHLGEGRQRAVQQTLFEEIEEKDATDLLLTSHAQVARALQRKGVPIINKEWHEVKDLYNIFQTNSERLHKNHPIIKPLVINAVRNLEIEIDLKNWDEVVEVYNGVKEKYDAKKDAKILLDRCVEIVCKWYDKNHELYATGTGNDAVEALVEKYDAVKPLVEFRKLDKFLTSYGEKLLAQLKNYSGKERLYPDYRIIGAPTGRNSTSNPSIQNIPDKPLELAGEKYDFQIREAFDYPEGTVGISCDLPNIELRVMAELSADEGMIQAFIDGKDLHSDTASRLFKVPYEYCLEPNEEKGIINPYWKENKPKRKKAKIVNFAIPYGVSEYGLSYRMEGTLAEAKEVMHNYLKVAYLRLGNWLTKNGEHAVNNLEARTYYGRRHKFSPHKTNKEKAAIRRNGLNSPIQGTAADIMKRCVVLVHEAIHPLGAKIVSVVHDEINVECPADVAETVRQRVEEKMNQGCREVLKVVPIQVTAKIVRDWAGK